MQDTQQDKNQGEKDSPTEATSTTPESGKKRRHVKKGGSPKRLVSTVIGIVIGLALGIGGVLAYQNVRPRGNQSSAQILTTSVVFERVQSQNEMIGASQRYNIVSKAQSTNKIPFTDIDIPFTSNSFWYRYVGTLKAGVDLSKATFEQDGSTIHVTLQAPYISSNTPDMDETGVLEESNNVLNPIHVEDVDALQKQCVEQSQSEVWNGTLQEECKSNVERNITDMFTAAFGNEYTIEFEWQG